MIEFLISQIISTQQVGAVYDNTYQYINYQLNQYNGRPVSFIANIPSVFHNKIREDADKSGWNVSIEKIPDPMYPAWKECYRFIMSPK